MNPSHSYLRYEFFIDMDGVLVDFDKEFQKHFPGVKETDDWKWEDLHAVCPSIYLIADPMPDAYMLIDFFSSLEYRNSPQILTAIPKRWAWPNVTKHKRAWIQEHWSDIPESDVLFGPYAEDKQFHCLSSFHVLIDDKIRNIEQWRNRGGIGIHHTSMIETLKQIGNLE